MKNLFVYLINYFVVFINLFRGVPQTITNLDVKSYMGTWYQPYTNILPVATFERNSYCVTANYKLNSNNTISVINSNRIGSPNGILNTLHGIATPTDIAKFDLYLDTAPVNGTYWILAVGPKLKNKYEWSIVSDSSGLFLFILARDIKRFNKMYEKDVLKLSNSLGFTGILQPIKKYQGSACVY